MSMGKTHKSRREIAEQKKREIERENEPGGGLRTGSLIILGGIPSLGKTTLALNIANNVAETGRDVLFFSLEMSRVELELKSVSRQTFVPDNSEHQIDSFYMKTIPEKASAVIDVYGKKMYRNSKRRMAKSCRYLS